jgi:sugar-specific transcriptional regulator TrmB
MKAIIEKQLVQWKEELAKQMKTKEQAEKVLMEANRTILMIEGGIQAKEMLLKKIESSDQSTGIVELGQQSEKAPSKK